MKVLDLTIMLEILDFVPIFWTIDAHGLWHLSTICIPLFWYRFIIDDNNWIDKEWKRIKNKTVIF
jgi:hypothetical protein